MERARNDYFYLVIIGKLFDGQSIKNSVTCVSNFKMSVLLSKSLGCDG